MAKRKRKDRKMKMGECRETKDGVTYCMTRKGVRFRSGRGRSRSLSGRGRKRGKCKRFKRVPMKGTRGKVRRCASYK